MQRLLSIRPLTILFGLLLIWACEPESGPQTFKDVYHDDLADISYHAGAFYATNYDLSGHAGSQIDILKFEISTEHIILSDAFDLEMNGQGYFSICNDGQALYLQSHDTQLILKTSFIGEKAYLSYDEVEDVWLTSGISVNGAKDSLQLLYRHSVLRDQFRLRTRDKLLLGSVGRDTIFTLSGLDEGSYGVSTFEQHDHEFYFLAVDTGKVDVLLIAPLDLSQFRVVSLEDSTVTGMTFLEDDLYLSYRDRRIEPWSNL